MKLSVSNIAWPSFHDDEMYSYLSQIGFDGLEIAPTRIFPEEPYLHILEARDWSKHIMSEYGLIVSSMQSIWYGRTENIFSSDRDRQILTDYTIKAIEFAEAIHCSNLVFGCPRNRDTDSVEAVMPIAIDFFYQIGQYAKEHNVVIALEANPPIYNTRFINNTQQAFDFVKMVGSAGLKVNLDFGTLLYNDERMSDLLNMRNFINHVHISEPFLKPIEKRNSHKELLGILKQIEYNGFVSIEMGNSTNLQNIKKTIEYVLSLKECV